MILETVKLAEDGSGDLICRLYEAAGSHTACVISTTLDFREAFTTTMEEKSEADQKLSVNRENGAAAISLTFRPFEIKTVRLSGQ